MGSNNRIFSLTSLACGPVKRSRIGGPRAHSKAMSNKKYVVVGTGEGTGDGAIPHEEEPTMMPHSTAAVGNETFPTTDDAAAASCALHRKLPLPGCNNILEAALGNGGAPKDMGETGGCASKAVPPPCWGGCRGVFCVLLYGVGIGYRAAEKVGDEHVVGCAGGKTTA